MSKEQVFAEIWGISFSWWNKNSQLKIKIALSLACSIRPLSPIRVLRQSIFNYGKSFFVRSVYCSFHAENLANFFSIYTHSPAHQMKSLPPLLSPLPCSRGNVKGFLYRLVHKGSSKEATAIRIKLDQRGRARVALNRPSSLALKPVPEAISPPLGDKRQGTGSEEPLASHFWADCRQSSTRLTQRQTWPISRNRLIRQKSGRYGGPGG